MFLADYAEFALPKTYLQNSLPSYRGVTRRLHVRRMYGGMGATKVNASNSIIATTKPTKITKIAKKPNPLKLKRSWF